MLQQLPPAQYLVMRLLRRMAPQKIISEMLDRGIYLSPGWDTTAPSRSFDQYEGAANKAGRTLKGARVCILGYGGGFAVALHMLEFGVAHVVLQDPFAAPRRYRNQNLDPEKMQHFFESTDSGWEPKAEFVTVTKEPMEEYAQTNPDTCDFVVSSSVLEHVSSLSTVVPACAKLTREGGLNIHIVDLRDHYFKYPFEMLCYSEQTWQDWLNASNNLNRWRLPQYQELFDHHFDSVTIDILESLSQEFSKAKHRIRSEFLTGDTEVDSVGLIRVSAVPRKSNQPLN